MIEETLRVRRSDIKDVAGQNVLTIRGKVLPVFSMSETSESGEWLLQGAG